MNGDSSDWELVSDEYIIGDHYEYDDGVKVDGTYYVYEDGKVYTWSGPLEEASGKRAGADFGVAPGVNPVAIHVKGAEKN